MEKKTIKKERRKVSRRKEDIDKEIESETTESGNMTKGKRRVILVTIVAILAVVITAIVYRGLYLETLEVGEQYVASFNTNFMNMALIIAINFFIIFTLIYVANRQIKKGLQNIFKDQVVPKIPNKSIAFIIGIIVSFAISQFIYNKLILFFNATQFEQLDPIFNFDLGYFIFTQPFIELLCWYVMIAIIGQIVYMGIYYIITLNFYYDGVERGALKESIIPKQLAKKALYFGIAIAVFFFVSTFAIETSTFVTQQNGTSYYLYGAGLTDVTMRLWCYRILSVVIIISVYVAYKAFINGKTKRMILSLIVVPIYLLIVFILLLIYQSAYVAPNELDKEKSYIQYNINATQNAYAISSDVVTTPESGTITASEINANSNTIMNTSIVSSDIVLKELQSGYTAKGYYTYKNTGIGVYNINGRDQLVYITPREIDNTGNTSSSEYTHGYGIVVTSANQTENSGNLVNMQKAFGNDKEVLAISEPRIYFGLATNKDIVTGKNEEFDYPILTSSKAENATNIYNGKAGLNLNFIDRTVLGIVEGNLNIVLASDTTNDTKIITKRNILERAKTVLPYLEYDDNPYMVVREDGSLVWVIDAYTETDKYPYSQYTELIQNVAIKKNINYIRNSCKVIIDAYTGETKFYITDKTDPIIMVYNKMYPTLFAQEQIPSDISAHFIYPQYLYDIQADIVARYHSVQPDVLYRGDDVWQIATHNTGKVLTKKGTKFESYYTMFNTTDSASNSNLGLIIPYTPYDKQNLISYLVGTCDSDGKLNLNIYAYSADSNVLGPMQLDTQIEKDEKIAGELEKINITGIKITKNMIIVPIGRSLLYIEAIYGQNINETGSLPILERVIVASGSKVAIGNNLTEALNALVSEQAQNIEVQNTDTLDDAVDAVIRANDNLTSSVESKDLEMIGKDTQKLQDLIEKLKELKAVEDAKKEELRRIANEQVQNIDTNVIVNEQQ